MNRVVSTWLAATAILLMAFENASADIKIGTFDSSRSDTFNLIDGGLSTDLRASLASNFPEVSLVGTPTLTDQFLSGVNAVIIHDLTGEFDTNSLTVAEQNSLLNFVKGGGSAWISLEGYVQNLSQTFISEFGVSLFSTSGYVYPDQGIIVDSSHPIINGPYGQVAQYWNDPHGWFSSLGPYAHTIAEMQQTGQPMFVVIEPNAIQPGSGKVIISIGPDSFSDPGFFGQFPQNETLFLNSMTWLLTVPEPPTNVLAALGLAGMTAWTWGRRQRRGDYSKEDVS